MRSAATSGSPSFRLRWLGYDRIEVDQFLQRAAADRQRVDDGLAVLEFLAAESPNGPAAAMALALREAQQIWANAEAESQRLVQEAQTEAEYLRLGYSAPLGKRTNLLDAVERWVGPLTIGRLSALAVSAVLFVVLVGVSTYQIVSGAAAASTERTASAGHSTTGPVPESSGGDTLHDLSATVPAGLLDTDSSVQGDLAEGLLVTLTAQRLCWVRTTTDDGEPVEHLLQPNETISVQANAETTLRIGDAAALSMRINEQPARSLGGDGEVVTARITRSNYSSFLVREPRAESVPSVVQNPDGSEYFE